MSIYKGHLIRKIATEQVWLMRGYKTEFFHLTCVSFIETITYTDMDTTAQKQAIIEKLASVEDEALLLAIQRMLNSLSPGSNLTP